MKKRHRWILSGSRRACCWYCGKLSSWRSVRSGGLGWCAGSPTLRLRHEQSLLLRNSLYGKFL